MEGAQLFNLHREVALSTSKLGKIWEGRPGIKARIMTSTITRHWSLHRQCF